MSDATLQDGPQALDEQPPSSKLVYLVLEQIEPATQQELRTHTSLSERTMRYALQRLDESNLIDTEPNLTDLRQKLYTTAE